MSRVLFTYADTDRELNSSIWRVFIPMSALHRAGHPTKAIWYGQANPDVPDVAELIDWADDLVVIERLPFMVRPFIAACKERGKRVFASLDDNYDLLADQNPSTAFWEKGQAHDVQLNMPASLDFNPKVELRAALAEMDGLIVPTQALAEYYRGWCPAVHVIPNYADLSGNLYYAARRPHVKPVIGWGGSFTHRPSWQDSNILPALQQLATKWDFDVLVCGSDTAIFEWVGQAVGQGRAWWQPHVVFEHWPGWCSQFDIGLAPLSPQGQDPYRSWIKCLEYGLLGVPWAASNMPSYRDARGGILVDNTAEGWYEALDRMLSAPDMRAYLVRQGADWAWEQGIDDHVDEYIGTLGLVA